MPRAPDTFPAHEVLEPFRVYALVGRARTGETHTTRKGNTAEHLMQVREAVNARKGDRLFEVHGARYLARPDGSVREVKLVHADSTYLEERDFLRRTSKVRALGDLPRPDTGKAAPQDALLPDGTPRVIHREDSPELRLFRHHLDPLARSLSSLRAGGAVDGRGEPATLALVDHHADPVVKVNAYFGEADGGGNAMAFQIEWNYETGQAVLHGYRGFALLGRVPDTLDLERGHCSYAMGLNAIVDCAAESFADYVRALADPEPAAAPAPR